MRRPALTVIYGKLGGLAIIAALGLACEVRVPLDGGSVDGNRNRNTRATNANQNSAGASTVRIRFRNLSVTNAVDVQFFAATMPLMNVPADLFVTANHITENIGLAGSGLLAPGSTDAITLMCTADLVVGTQGGEFRDNESGASRGLGPMRFAMQGPQFSCGATITYTFDDADGNFNVTQSIE